LVHRKKIKLIAVVELVVAERKVYPVKPQPELPEGVQFDRT